MRTGDSHRLNCTSITDEDIRAFRQKLQNCTLFTPGIVQCKFDNLNNCTSIPTYCNGIISEVIYRSISLATAFSNNHETSNPSESAVYTAAFLPIPLYWVTSRTVGYVEYKQLESDIREYSRNLQHLDFVGLQFDMKMDAFAEAIIIDLWYVLYGLVCITIINLLYSNSILYTLSVEASVIFS